MSINKLSPMSPVCPQLLGTDRMAIAKALQSVFLYVPNVPSNIYIPLAFIFTIKVLTGNEVLTQQGMSPVLSPVTSMYWGQAEWLQLRVCRVFDVNVPMSPAFHIYPPAFFIHQYHTDIFRVLPGGGLYAGPRQAQKRSRFRIKKEVFVSL
jgi:hypothetical protein